MHPKAAKALASMQALEKKPWSPKLEKVYQGHVATFHKYGGPTVLGGIGGVTSYKRKSGQDDAVLGMTSGRSGGHAGYGR
jgi:hypothetical protein